MKKQVLMLTMLGLAITVSAPVMALDFKKLSSAVSNVTSGGNTTVDVNGFLAKAQETNQLFTDSRTQLALMLADKGKAAELEAKLQALKATSDLKEKQAINAEINNISQSVVDAAKNDQDATANQLAQAGDDVKKKAIAAVKNFGLAALKANELVPASQQVTTTIATNPQLLLQSNVSAGDAKSLISNVSGIASNSSLALVDMPKIFTKAKIKLEMPTSAAAKAEAVAF